MDVRLVAEEYLNNIFQSIAKNAKCLREDEKIQELLRRSNQFYVSLFSRQDGIFKSDSVDRKLKAPPRCRPAARSPQSSQSSQSATTKGLGKGSPGCSRKANVTRRQQLNRAKKNIQASHKRKAPAAPAQPDINPPPPAKRPAATNEATTCQLSRDQIDQPEPESPPTQQIETVQMAPIQMERSGSSSEDEEPRQPIRAQWQINKEIKAVSMIQDLCKTRKDQQPESTELELFWELMDSWDVLDRRLVIALKDMQNDWLESRVDWRTTEFIKLILLFHSTNNGVTNCLHHILGSMVKHAVKKNDENNEDANAQETFEALEDRLKDNQYLEYALILKNCGCELCARVLQFDDRYERYWNDPSDRRVEAPKLEQRPMHCNRSEIHAQYLRNKYKGLSAATLSKYYYFGNSTNPFSPPAISLGTPTQVYEAANRYMKPFLDERKLDDPIPSSWILPPTHEVERLNLIEVQRDNFHLYDGDSCEIRIDGDTDPAIATIRTGRNKVSIRLPGQDAPETSHSVRIYRQTEDEPAASMHTFATRHIGIESLRAARRIVFEAKNIYVHVGRDRFGNPAVPLDFYGRRLIDVWLDFDDENDGETKVRLSSRLAAIGYTMSFYATGIDKDIDDAMRSAKRAKRGIFNLPEELFCSPFRPWEFRHGMKTNPSTYKEYRPILNRPEDPAVAWKPAQRAPPVEDDDVWPESQDHDSFYFRMVPCPLHVEALCFRAKSTLPDAGYGLFLKPHGPIGRGTHLCLYSDQPTTEEDLERAGSSRMYVLEATKGVYDAEHETGNNLGRYANQPNVLEALRFVKQLSTQPQPEMTENNWNDVEKEIDSFCNANFKVVGKQLVLVAKIHLESRREPEEVFVNYGSIRKYWIQAESQNPGCFGGEISTIIHFLLHSDQSNWTEKQRLEWSSQ